ncbi:MAG: hypothetical protein ACR2MS_02335, partial [Weeksellaceae bacterium]
LEDFDDDAALQVQEAQQKFAGVIFRQISSEVFSVSGPFTIPNQKCIVLVDATTAPVVINLNNTHGKEITIKKIDATPNAVSVLQNVDGAPLSIVTPMESARIIGDGQDYYTV